MSSRSSHSDGCCSISSNNSQCTTWYSLCMSHRSSHSDGSSSISHSYFSSSSDCGDAIGDSCSRECCSKIGEMLMRFPYGFTATTFCVTSLTILSRNVTQRMDWRNVTQRMDWSRCFIAECFSCRSFIYGLITRRLHCRVGERLVSCHQ